MRSSESEGGGMLEKFLGLFHKEPPKEQPSKEPAMPKLSESPRIIEQREKIAESAKAREKAGLIQTELLRKISVAKEAKQPAALEPILDADFIKPANPANIEERLMAKEKNQAKMHELFYQGMRTALFENVVGDPGISQFASATGEEEERLKEALEKNGYSVSKGAAIMRAGAPMLSPMDLDVYCIIISHNFDSIKGNSFKKLGESEGFFNPEGTNTELYVYIPKQSAGSQPTNLAKTTGSPPQFLPESQIIK